MIEQPDGRLYLRNLLWFAVALDGLLLWLFIVSEAAIDWIIMLSIWGVVMGATLLGMIVDIRQERRHGHRK